MEWVPRLQLTGSYMRGTSKSSRGPTVMNAAMRQDEWVRKWEPESRKYGAWPTDNGTPVLLILVTQKLAIRLGNLAQLRKTQKAAMTRGNGQSRA